MVVIVSSVHEVVVNAYTQWGIEFTISQCLVPNHSNMFVIMGKHLNAIIPGVNDVHGPFDVKINICWGRKLASSMSLASKCSFEVEIQIKNLYLIVVTIIHVQLIILVYAKSF